MTAFIDFFILQIRIFRVFRSENLAKVSDGDQQADDTLFQERFNNQQNDCKLFIYFRVYLIICLIKGPIHF